MRTALILLLFCAAYLRLQVVSSRAQSATFDEPVHLAAGYLALARGDYGFEPSHPPFLREWAALPLLRIPQRTVDLSARASMNLQEWSVRTNAVARDFLNSQPDPDRALGRARLMITLLGVVLGALVFLWSRELLGERTAIVALALFAIGPNLAAHAGLVTTDFGLTLFYFGTAYFLWRLQRTFTFWNVAGVCVFFSLALVSKFSAVILAPIGVVLLAASVVHRFLTLRRAVIVAVLAGLWGWFAIWAAYGFHYAPGPGAPELRADLIPGATNVAPMLTAVLGWVDSHRLLPSAYSQGFIWCQISATNLDGFLFGELSRTGWWYYFPVAVLLKTALVSLGLVAAGFVLLARNRQTLVMDGIFLLLPAAVYLGAAMTSSLDIGVRHVLPLAPFGLVIAGYAIRELVNGAVAARVGLGILVAAAAVEFFGAYPYPLTFFNMAAGGSRGGARYLSDSNVDWGQGLKALRSWAVENKAGRINVAYFGPADPVASGIDCVRLPTETDFDGTGAPILPGYVVISPTVLALSGREPRLKLLYGGFNAIQPVAIVGNALRVYRIDEWPIPAAAKGASAEELEPRLALANVLYGRFRWTSQAVRLYRSYIEARPGDSKVIASLGLLFLTSGSLDEAVKEFDRAIPLDPDPAALADTIASVLLRGGNTAQAASYTAQAARLRNR